jgi:hypothetical protein
VPGWIRTTVSSEPGLQPGAFVRSATGTWGDRRVPPPLRPGSRPGSSLLGSITVPGGGIGPPPTGCGPAALPLS